MPNRWQLSGFVSDRDEMLLAGTGCHLISQYVNVSGGYIGCGLGVLMIFGRAAACWNCCVALSGSSTGVFQGSDNSLADITLCVTGGVNKPGAVFPAGASRT